VGQPFDDERDHGRPVTRHRVHQSPVPFEVVFPEVVNPVFRDVRFRDQPLGHLGSAEGIGGYPVESLVEQSVNILIPGPA